MNTEYVATERWGIAELSFYGPDDGNPFVDVSFGARFTLGARSVQVAGFYDGHGTYRIRFMPDEVGIWNFSTYSTAGQLSGISGQVETTAATGDNHGPILVDKNFDFKYADETPYFPVGTTSYAWAHQSDSLKRRTLETLRLAPFNKIRMCLFPKDYVFNTNEPDHFVFPQTAAGAFDTTRFNPEFFSAFETLLFELREQQIEADLILFHPYDRWGFATLQSDECDRYLRYVVARLGAFRNVWWSFANEWDFMKNKSVSEWDQHFRTVQRFDPYQHPRSIHNGKLWYDHLKPWVTHLSVQSSQVELVDVWRKEYAKPVCVDECCYEGDIPNGWGNITAEELVRRSWETTLRGGYPTAHGETFMDENDVLWWAKGGILKGASAERIGFLRRVIESLPHGRLDPKRLNANDVALWCDDGAWCLRYTGFRQPRCVDIVLPEDREYTVELIDTWSMTTDTLAGTFRGENRIELPGKPYMALCCRAVS